MDNVEIFKSVSTKNLKWFKEYLESKKYIKSYIPTSLIKLDNYIDGLYGGCLYLIGARPGIGKTTLVLNLLAKQKNKKCLIFTTEIPKERYMEKFLSLISGTEYKSFRQNTFNMSETITNLEKLGEYNATFVDIYKPTIKQIENSVKELSPEILFFDYFQNILIENQTYGYQEYTRNAEAIFNIGRRYNIPVILCSQLKRFPESRKEDSPELSDFKETGKLEESAHVAMLLYQDNNDLVIKVAKNRDGQIGEVKLKGNWSYNTLEEVL